jgi:hypothetical protein
MSRHIMAASALSLLIGCATASPGIMMGTVARVDAFECARDLLSAKGYEILRADAATQLVEAEVRRAHSPMGAVREIILAAVEPQPDTKPALTVHVRSFDYAEAAHGLPIYRQTVQEVRPSAQVATDADQLLRSCGVEESERFGPE